MTSKEVIKRLKEDGWIEVLPGRREATGTSGTPQSPARRRFLTPKRKSRSQPSKALKSKAA